MPFAYGALGIHDDINHTGSAKRDTANGVAGISASGNILSPAAGVNLTRSGADEIYVNERTSGEMAMSIKRTGANTYTLYNNTVAGGKIIQDSSMKDVVSGIVAQDASGNATVTGPALYLTRDGNGDIIIRERTSSEIVLYARRKAVNSYAVYQTVGGSNLVNAFLDGSGDIPHMRPKAASATLRHSHDAETNGLETVYTKRKTMTFANGISGTLRVSFDMHATNPAFIVYARVYKNGVAIGTEQSDVTGGYVTKTEDINVGVLAPNDTLELWAYTTDAANGCWLRNFRASYDNAADTVLVAGVTTS